MSEKDEDGRTWFPEDLIQKPIKQSYVTDTIDIVRCKECTHRRSIIEKDNSVLIACYKMKDDDFCSYGERWPKMRT